MGDAWIEPRGGWKSFVVVVIIEVQLHTIKFTSLSILMLDHIVALFCFVFIQFSSVQSLSHVRLFATP